MKQIITGLFLILSLCAWGTFPLQHDSVVAISGGSYDYLTLFWTAEQEAHDADDYPESGVTWTLASGAAINTDAAYSGTNGVEILAWDTAYISDSGSDYIDTDIGRVGAWYNRNSLLSGLTIWSYNIGGTEWSSVTNGIRLYYYATNDTLVFESVVGSTSTKYTSTTTVSMASGWHYVEVSWDYSAATNYVNFYVGGVKIGNTVTNTDTTVNDGSGGYLAVGEGTNEAGYIDNLSISSTADADMYTDLSGLSASPK